MWILSVAFSCAQSPGLPPPHLLLVFLLVFFLLLSLSTRQRQTPANCIKPLTHTHTQPSPVLDEAERRQAGISGVNLFSILPSPHSLPLSDLSTNISALPSPPPSYLSPGLFFFPPLPSPPPPPRPPSHPHASVSIPGLARRADPHPLSAKPAVFLGGGHDGPGGGTGVVDGGKELALKEAAASTYFARHNLPH